MQIVQRIWNWFDEVTGVSGWLIPLAKHPVPPARKSAWFYVLGSATLFVFIVQVVTALHSPAPMFPLPDRLITRWPLSAAHGSVTLSVAFTPSALRRWSF